MFGRNHFVNNTENPFEDLSSRPAFRCVAKVVEDDNKDVIVTYENKSIDLSTPIPPQSGLGTLVGDLSFAPNLRNITHSPSLISALDNTNPLSSYRAARSLVDTAASHFEEKNNDEQK